MITIYRYEIPIQDEFELVVPRGSMALKIDVQYGVPFVWTMVDTEQKETTTLKCALRRTGQNCEGLGPDKYLATFQLMGGSLVYHLFSRA